VSIVRIHSILWLGRERGFGDSSYKKTKYQPVVIY
jgi:hypothetical protein